MHDDFSSLHDGNTIGSIGHDDSIHYHDVPVLVLDSTLLKVPSSP